MKISKYEIIYTEDYAYVISESPILSGDFRINLQRMYISKIERNEEASYYNKRNDVFKKVIGHLPLDGGLPIKGLPLLPEFSQEDDVDKIAITEHEFNHKTVDEISFRLGFKEGYNKAKETYKYTEEDLREVVFKSALSATDDLIERCDEIIPSLNQPKLPKHFECETEPLYKWVGAVKGVYGSGHKLKNELAGQPKTTTNSQGQTELVGKYIYK